VFGRKRRSDLSHKKEEKGDGKRSEGTNHNMKKGSIRRGFVLEKREGGTTEGEEGVHQKKRLKGRSAGYIIGDQYKSSKGGFL